MLRKLQLGWLLLLASTGVSYAAEYQGFQIDVLVDGEPAPEYFHNATTYIEAIKGKEYAVRLVNLSNTRVAVALSVDGLNTIDARHTESNAASKWVLGPYERITIRGWQVNSRQSRRFFFTTEEKSYGNFLGQTRNLGIISAVFFRERAHNIEAPSGGTLSSESQRDNSKAQSRRSEQESSGMASAQPPKDDYAATGIGRRVQNQVQRIQMDLEPTPAARLNVRYEFRTALTKLGVLPQCPITDPLVRRQSAHGFRDAGFCPEPR